MTRRSFLQRAAGAVALTLAAVYSPSLKAVAVMARPPIPRKTGSWVSVETPSDLVKRIFMERAHDVCADNTCGTISGLFYGGTRQLHRDCRNEFGSWHASPTPPPGAYGVMSANDGTCVQSPTPA